MATANHVLLRRITLTSDSSSVVFDSIPQTGYTDLKVVTSTRGTSTDSPVAVKFNSVTTGYNWKRLYGSGSAASSEQNTDNYFMYHSTSSQTANTFGSGELYIPNYTGSQQKTCSFDSLNENNATAAEIFMLVGRNTMTAAISSITFTPYSGNFAAGSSFSLYGIADVNTIPLAAPKADGGDIIKTDGTYWYHAFLSTGSFKPQLNLTADVLVIAGGGAGAGSFGGGGGAGGYLEFASQSLTNTSNYICTVGAGAAGNTSTRGSNGGDSQFSSLTLVKGGGGGGVYGINGGASIGSDGGSGGGAGSASIANAGGNPTSGQGYAGGSVSLGVGAPYYTNAGGGGAGAAGASITSGSQAGGAGGIGKYTALTDAIGSATGLGVLSGGHYYYAGGGGAGSYGGGGTGAGGTGGGGGGTSGAGGSGIANTGGGSASAGGNSGAASGNGGSGVIIIRYPV